MSIVRQQQDPPAIGLLADCPQDIIGHRLIAHLHQAREIRAQGGLLPQTQPEVQVIHDLASRDYTSGRPGPGL
jgi:hypothetical protein